MKKINLKADKSEEEWQTSWDKFILSATPLCFQWLGWVIILGALSYLSVQTKSIPLIIVTILSYTLLHMYFVSFFFQFQFINLPFMKTQKHARFISLLISAVAGMVIWFLVILIIKVLEVTGT